MTVLSLSLTSLVKERSPNITGTLEIQGIQQKLDTLKLPFIQFGSTMLFLLRHVVQVRVEETTKSPRN